MLLFFTIVAVSIDAYLASLAYGIKNKLNIGEIVYAASFTFVLCAITLLISSVMAGYGQLFKLAGGLIFIGLGLKSFLPQEEQTQVMGKRGFRELAVLGIGVAADAALACLSIEAVGYRIIVYAFFMCAAHFLFICCGMATAKGLGGLTGKLQYLSGAFLIGLGLFKLLG